jgi:hypothetical protein
MCRVGFQPRPLSLRSIPAVIANEAMQPQRWAASVANLGGLQLASSLYPARERVRVRGYIFTHNL